MKIKVTRNKPEIREMMGRIDHRLRTIDRSRTTIEQYSAMVKDQESLSVLVRNRRVYMSRRNHLTWWLAGHPGFDGLISQLYPPIEDDRRR